MISAIRFTSCLLLMIGGEALGATVSLVSAVRYVESNAARLFSVETSGQFDQSLSYPETGSFAGQQSFLSPQRMTVASQVMGAAVVGTSAFVVAIHLEEATSWQATGSFSIKGTSGFACMSLSDQGHTTLFLNEVLGDPPAADASRSWTASGFLPAGDYVLDAIVHSGGTGLAHSGFLEMTFTIPEPSVLLLTPAFLLRRWRIRGRHGLW